MNENEWLRSAWEEGLIKEDEDPNVNRERTSKSWLEEWQSKRETKDLSRDDTWQWLQGGELKKETEGMIMAAQDQVLRTRYIFGTNISPIRRIFNKKYETINHITSECPALAHRISMRRDMTQGLELCTGIYARNTKCLAVISGMNINYSH